MLNVNTVTVVGANGTMGASVAGIFASFGQAKVYLVSRTLEKSKKAVEVAIKSVRAESIRARLIPKTYEDLEKCVEESDWVFESVAENIDLKIEINKKIANARKKGTVISTGTSGLSISELSKCFDAEGQSMYMGTHFFNPPYNLPLCEIIPTEATSSDTLTQVKDYLDHKLLRQTVLVKDVAGFLANRIGFQFLNEIAQLAEKYQERGGIDYLDSIFGGFSGRGMKPLVTVDFVGLDIHKAIVDYLLVNTSDFSNASFKMPTFIQKLINKGSLGRKSGEGFYKLHIDDDGNKSKLVYDIESGDYRKAKRYKFTFAESMVNAIKEGDYEGAINVLRSDRTDEAQICQYLLYKYVLYSCVVSGEVSESYNDADIAMGYGFSWMPPLAFLGFIGGVEKFIEDISGNVFYNSINLSKEEISKILENAKATKIDSRKFFKAKY